ncbi:MAG: copper amine oxidase N-terminal domain-containing protein [Bacillota bacterium]|nr:copper amine oxidase N-terminal domain-containing protein [Bacillota bacterium]
MFKSIKTAIIFTVFFSLFIILISTKCYAQTSSYKVFLDQRDLTPGTQPINIKGRIMLPVRKLLEFIDADFEWVPEKKIILITDGHKNIELWANSKISLVNGKKIMLDVPAIIRNGRTYVPIRFLAEALEMTVYWDEALNTVTIKRKTQSNIEPSDNNPEADSEEYIDSPTPTEEVNETPTPSPNDTPVTDNDASSSNNSPVSTPLVSTPSVSQPVIENIKATINGEDLDYQFIGARLIDIGGTLYADRLFTLVSLRVYCVNNPDTKEYQLIYYTDENEENYIVLKTKPVQEQWIPILDVCKELNLNCEYTNSTLSITEDAGSENDYLLDSSYGKEN